jgi:membrane-associated phospholipid phosphatase
VIRRIPKTPDQLRKFIRRRFTREGALGLYLTVGFFACAVLVVVLTILAHEVFEVAGPGPVDRAVTLAVRRLQSPSRDSTMLLVTRLGDFRFLIPMTILASIVFAIRHRRVSAVLFLGAVLGGFLLESLMKITFRRDRPDLWPALVTEKSYSFPSGHATMCTLYFGACAAIVFHVTRKHVPRVAAVVTATVLSLSVAFSRIFLGAHWLTDVCAGMLLGVFWVVVCATGTELLARRVPK